MKKLLALVFGLVVLSFGTSAFAEVSSETLAEVIHTAEDTAYPEALEGKFDYGKNHSETDLLCDEIDLSKMYRRYTIIYPTEEFYDYYFIPENTGLFQFIRDESMDSEIYVGEGKAGKMYYIRINDPWYGITEKDVEENPELHAGAFKYGEEPYSLCHETTLTYNFDLDEYAEILLKEGIESVYDAYFSAFHIGSQTSQHKYYVMYFDTDKGEYILNIDSENVRAGQKSDEELEYMKLYPLSELYDIAKIVLNDITEYHSGKSGTYIDENGDDIEKEKGTWDINRFIDISLKNHSIVDTFDISLLHQDADGNYLAISKPDSEDYDTIIDLSKVLKVYHIAIDEKEAVMGYDGSGLVEYFSDYFLDGEQHLFRYIMTDEDGTRNHLLITDDEYNHTDIGNSAESWENGISEALAVVNDSNISEIYDAYSFSWSTRIRYNDNSRRNVGRDLGVYLDTDKGEFVVFYDNGEDSTFARKFTKAEILKLYPVQDFLDIVAKNYDEAGVIVRENVEIVNKDGDSEQVTIVQKPVQSEDKEEKEELNKPEEKDETEQSEKTEIDVTLYGEKLLFPDQKPVVDNERVLVPFRVIFEALGADVLWDGETWTVTAQKGDTTISLTIGEKKIVKNGEVIDIDVPAQVQNERTLVPIRVVSESFGNTVVWNGENKTVEIK